MKFIIAIRDTQGNESYWRTVKSEPKWTAVKSEAIVFDSWVTAVACLGGILNYQTPIIGGFVSELAIVKLED